VNGGIAPLILDFDTTWRWVVNFTTQPLYPGEGGPSTHWMGRWADPRTVWAWWRRKKSRHCPHWELNPGRQVRSLVSILIKIPQPHTDI